MSNWKKSVLIALGVALIFSLFYLATPFNMIEERIYDMFLRFRPKRERLSNILFLDVDDLAIEHTGVFPWPRSVVADGLLRLKEYGALNVIFDIEYIDNSPTQVDEVYLRDGLEYDFNMSFSEVKNNVSALLSRPETVAEYAENLFELINDEQNYLYGKVKSILRNNDQYLSEASALFGHSWVTLNLQNSSLEGEQVNRRTIAQEKFSYPVKVLKGGNGGNNVDILPPIPLFMEAARGAGYTNIIIDEDGIRRRIYLTREVQGHWYLQLAFAPLMEYLGMPDLELESRRLTIKNARFPAGSGGTSLIRDIVIPLDKKGAMLLDWPVTDYFESYDHVSFAMFSYLEEYQTLLHRYSGSLASGNEDLFTGAVQKAAEIKQLFDAAGEELNMALTETSDDSFRKYLNLRDEAFIKIQALLDSGVVENTALRGEELEALYPDQIDMVRSETHYILTLLDYLKITLTNYRGIEDTLKERVRDRICILGRVDTGTTDIGVNPFYGEYINVGTHAVVLDTILSRAFIQPLNSYWSIAFCFILVPLIIITINRFKPGIRIILGFSGVLVVTGVSFLLFYTRGIFLGPLGPVLALITAVIVQETLAFVGSEQEKQFIRKAFSTYLSGDVVQEILADPSRLQLGGAKRHMTAIFTDIQGFSTISEKLDPEDLVRLLNRYLSAMSNVILENKGTIDKYEGDAIIAFFGAPLNLSDHALRSCQSAIVMKQMEKELNRQFLEDGLSPSPILTRIGINTGSMVVGNMGTNQKMDYTIMGNAVNLAARLEGVNKQYGTWILASYNTLQETNNKIFYRRLDKVRVVGINEPVRLCEILEMTDSAPQTMQEMAGLFHEALDLFEAKNWVGAQAAFAKVLRLAPEDKPAKLFSGRCKQYQTNPPSEDWDGVYNLSQK
ncbi:MAG: CHASE2 domain-containing protein [Treponema sp.]|jgi:adenylate cyclase|nr:CHASE2 domain-containing protein [Treponema sp.]